MRNQKIMANPLRLITEEELNKVNPNICLTFGTRNVITSGTCESYGRNKKRYHIVMENMLSHQPMSMIRNIGRKVKMIWQADEVYYFGTRIA